MGEKWTERIGLKLQIFQAVRSKYVSNYLSLVYCER